MAEITNEIMEQLVEEENQFKDAILAVVHRYTKESHLTGCQLASVLTMVTLHVHDCMNNAGVIFELEDDEEEE